MIITPKMFDNGLVLLLRNDSFLSRTININPPAGIAGYTGVICHYLSSSATIFPKCLPSPKY